ncbi:MAG: mechanosensitive ion channel family protein [Longimicrobiales bacterium]|nr:mechanosensitive ion channel family protein [Longimicrobiales bacterium]
MQFFENVDLESLIPLALDLIGAVLLLLITIWVAKWGRKVTRRALEARGMDPTLTRFTANLVRYGVLILGGLTVLSVFGVSVASFAAILAAAGFALGLALQGTLGNFSAGAMLLIFRPFKVGDVVEVSGVRGKVVEIDLFTTQFDTPDNRRFIVPNGQVFGSTIENVTFHETRRVDVDVGTSYDADLRETRAILGRVAAETEGGLEEPEPQVYLQQLGGSSIDWTVRVWARTEDYWAVKERLTHSIKIALDDAGIGIPYPQMDVHLDGELGGAPTPPR